MKKWYIFLLFSSLIMLSACGGNDPDTDSVTDTNNNQTTTQENNTVNDPNTNTNDGTITQNETTSTFPFSSFDLDVDYANFKSFEVEYENDVDETEAKIKDELNNRTLRGDEAFQEMQNRFQSFQFDQNSPEETVVQEVLKSFELDDNYEKFELEITFTDGTEKEYHVMKK